MAAQHCGWWALVPLLPLLAVAAWPDPHRAERLRAEADAAAAHEETVAAAQAPSFDPKGIAEISFPWLSFPVRPGTAATDTQEPSYNAILPQRIKRLDGTEVRIRGFMVPTREEGGKVREFMILPSRMTCCYGQSPRFCEFLVARMRGNPVPARMDEAASFEGVLHVGDVYVNGYWSALYSLDCSTVIR